MNLYLMLFGMTIKEAKKILEEKGLIMKLNVGTEEGIDKETTIIKDQVPKQNIKQEKGGYVMCDI